MQKSGLDKTQGLYCSYNDIADIAFGANAYMLTRHSPALFTAAANCEAALVAASLLGAFWLALSPLSDGFCFAAESPAKSTLTLRRLGKLHATC